MVCIDFEKEKSAALDLTTPPPGGEDTPLRGLYRYVWPERVWLLAVLFINRVSILAILVVNGF